MKVTNTTEFLSALASANPGDTIEMAEGVYERSKQVINGVSLPTPFELTRPGTEQQPITIKAERGKHVDLIGNISVRAKDWWIWGVHVNGFDARSRDSANGHMDGAITGHSGISEGLQIINCVISDGFKSNGITLWKGSARQLAYGNIVYGITTDTGQPHATYCQNDFAASGKKRLIRNVCLDSSETSRISFTLRGYGTNAPISGFEVIGNVSRNGRSLFGCENQFPAYNNVIKNNYYCGSWPEMGYKTVGHGQVEDNYIVLRTADDGGAPRAFHNCQWGTNEQRYAALQASLNPYSFRRNKIFMPDSQPKPIYGVRTSRFPTPTNEPVFGDTSLNPSDLYDFNEIHGNPWFQLQAKGTSLSMSTLAEWRAATAAAGCEYDAHSTHDNFMPTTNEVVLLDNEFDPWMMYLVVYNWEKKLAENMLLPANAKVYKAKDSFGLTIAAGKAVSIPLDQSQLMDVFVIKFDEAEQPEDPMDLTEEIELAESIAVDIDFAVKKLVPIPGYPAADIKLKNAQKDNLVLIQKLKDKNK